MKANINAGRFSRNLIISAAASIEIPQQSINELNVFPVPDGDTGTNMSMTIHSAVADLKKAEAHLEKAALCLRHLCRGAGGNSGVIHKAPAVPRHSKAERGTECATRPVGQRPPGGRGRHPTKRS
ncbi:MAG: DAK2 domain-containing protein [Oscillospiraceae bacterium]